MQAPQPATPTPAKPAPQTPAKPVPQAPDQSAPQPPAPAPRRPAAARSGSVSFAVRVSDPARQPIAGVKVSVEGPAQRQATTEGGRIAFENLPAGRYLFRFEHEGFITLERQLTAAAAARPDQSHATVNPRLPRRARTASPAGPEPAAPLAAPPPPDVNAAPVTVDSPDFISKNFVGRESQKICHWRAAGCRPRR